MVAVVLGALSISIDVAHMYSLPREVTILTEPLEELESHGHETSRGDSLQSKGHVEGVLSKEYVFDTPLWVTGMEIVTKNAPQNVVHHMHLLTQDIPDVYCPKMGTLLMDVGQDAIPFANYPKGYGLYIPAGQKLLVNAALHNPDPPLGTGDDYHNVSVGFTLRIDRFGSLKQLKPVALHIASLADRDLCNATTFTVPPRTTHYEKRSKTSDGSTIVVKRSGTIVAMGAHIHAWEGGESLTVYKNGEWVTTFIPHKTNEDPVVWQTDPYYEKVRVETGDTLTISSTYSNPYDVPVTGAMGMAAFFIHYDER